MAADPISDHNGAEAFKSEVRFWAQRLEVNPAGHHLAGMRHEWASGSPRGHVTFDVAILANLRKLGCNS